MAFQFDEYVKIQAKYSLLQEINDIIIKSYAGEKHGFQAKVIPSGFRPEPATFFHL